ncbi:MBL fold metallo-hydrolase [Conexibacter sp. DBS9H8]|uniref:MBL fold metallo-hydrolase n=1 Tax=Conexibacter sp. DBS9H8 TaxID=2937801 RepID=UPI00200BC116|nr:MBL fold metallo-hydrolase [Conexibacter sp. DBS9H8]
MVIAASQSTRWLSNTYLVYAEGGEEALLIDAGGPVAPLLDILERTGRRLSHVLITHHHHDHVDELDAVLTRCPGAVALAHPTERYSIDSPTEAIEPGTVHTFAGLEVTALATPGHTGGMLAFLVGDRDVFTGDTLFAGSVGGVNAPGATSFGDLRHSVMDVLLTLPPETVIHPGHSGPTTVADEREHNPFVRVWRGLDPEGERPCTVAGPLPEPGPATVVCAARDYDGGEKLWIRWADGSDDIIPGSWLAAAGQTVPAPPTPGSA